MSESALSRDLVWGAAGLTAVAGILGLASALSIEADRLRLPAPAPGSGIEARLPVAFSVRRFAADRSWIDILQYVGDPSFVLDHGARLPAMTAATTNLDPTFRDAYAFGAALLFWECGRPNEAAALLRRGIAHNPQSNKLRYYLAAFTYRRLKDLGREVAVLEVLARDPNAPIILRRILANAYVKQGRIDLAAGIWRLVWLEDRNPDDRRWVAVQCEKHRVDLGKLTAGQFALLRK